MKIILTKQGPLRKTLWPELNYQNQGDGTWRFISTEGGGVVGSQYPSEKVLLADMRYYAKRFWGLE